MPDYFEDKTQNYTQLYLTLASKKVLVEREVPSYSFLSLVADCGGLLGLFIGFNFLMIFDFLVEIYQKMKSTQYKVFNKKK